MRCLGVCLAALALTAAQSHADRARREIPATNARGVDAARPRDPDRTAAANPASDSGVLARARDVDHSSALSLSERWHDVPQQPRLKLSTAITDELTELGNLIGASMNELSDDALGLKFDGRRRRAKLRVGTGEGQYLRFRLDSDWHFTQGRARIVAKLQLGIGEHQWNVELPDMEMAPASYQGHRGVEIRIPFFERKF